MKTLAAFLLLLASAFGQSPQSSTAQIVDFPSGNLRMKGYLWKPSGPGPFPAIMFNHGSGGTDAMQTAGMPMSQAAQIVASVFLKHGYVFFYPCRRGHGLSADQGEFIQDALKKEEAAKGIEARQKLQIVLLTGPQFDDTLAALSFLKTVPGIDVHRIAVVGHSFGGALTLLDAERDSSLRAAVTFAAAANSWAKAPALRVRLLAAVNKTKVPMMLIHAANDYDTNPGRELAAELERLHNPHVLKIYPAAGKTSDDGHNVVYNSISRWESDVFDFLDKYVRQ